jgi:hypothetical protein
MSEFIRKSHNVSVLLYRIACPAKYRRVAVNEKIDKTISGDKGDCVKGSVRNIQK